MEFAPLFYIIIHVSVLGASNLWTCEHCLTTDSKKQNRQTHTAGRRGTYIECVRALTLARFKLPGALLL